MSRGVGICQGLGRGRREAACRLGARRDAEPHAKGAREAGARSRRARVPAPMADVQPLRTLRFEPSAVGSLDDVISPPYDVIDDELRAKLVARSPYNAVRIDLPASYAEAAETLRDWREIGRAHV